MDWSRLFPSFYTGPTPDPLMVAFNSGVAALGCIVVSLFFLRFWRRTGDGLFAAFAVACVLLAANEALPVLLNRPAHDHSEIYLLRLAAFVVIIVAILGKNLPRGRRTPPPRQG